MKKHIILFVAALAVSLCGGSLFAQENCSALIPMPNSIVQGEGMPFEISEGRTSIYVSHPELSFAAQQLQQIIDEEMQLEIHKNSHTTSSDQILTFMQPLPYRTTAHMR